MESAALGPEILGLEKITENKVDVQLRINSLGTRNKQFDDLIESHAGAASQDGRWTAYVAEYIKIRTKTEAAGKDWIWKTPTLKWY
jgi:hypothetical protein